MLIMEITFRYHSSILLSATNYLDGLEKEKTALREQFERILRWAFWLASLAIISHHSVDHLVIKEEKEIHHLKQEAEGK